MSQIRIFIRSGFFLLVIFLFTQTALAAFPGEKNSISKDKIKTGKEKTQEAGKQPMTINGDRVEFKSEGKEAVAEGNVEIVYHDSTMTCDRVRVFIDEKLAIAEGHVQFIKKEGEALEGDTIIYDFNAQSGTIISPHIRMFPYYGKAGLMEKISDTEFVLNEGEISTCDLPHPHYNLSCQEVTMKPGNIVTAKGVKVSLGDVPIMYLPSFSQRLTDDRPTYMIIPGNKKNLGMELFGSYRYYLTETTKGVLHLDWYQKKGWAEGIDLNYDTKGFGTGNAKYYRISEADSRKDLLAGNLTNDLGGDATTKERSRIELRHKWDASNVDHMVMEYYRESDPNFRRDYFLKEYEKVTNPQSFFLWSHVFPDATLSLLGSPRVNKFDTVLERIPELKLETVNQKIAAIPLYFKDSTTMTHLVNAPANLGAAPDVSRVDTSNQFSYLFKFMSIDFSPFIGHRDTYYSRQMSIHTDAVRSMFFTGVDMSTKFFKVYNVYSDANHLDINKLRHIVTPSIQYRYQDAPTINKFSLFQLDEVDALEKQDMVTLSLENKLQTKRGGASVDLATLILATDYNIERNTTVGKGFQDVQYKLEFKPYAAWELDSQGIYDTVHKNFQSLSTDFWNNVGKVSTVVGYRYKQGESSQLTTGFTCPLNPFWKLGVYERFEFKTGHLVEQEYTLDRDLHCWTVQFIINQHEGNGVSFLVAFKLKAFPEIGARGQTTFAPPRSPSQ